MQKIFRSLRAVYQAAPATIRLVVCVYLVAACISVSTRMWSFHSDQGVELFYLGLATVLATAVVAGVVYLVLRRHGWVRWLLVLFVLPGLAGFGQSIADNALGDWTVIDAVIFASNLVIAALVFTPSANDWFREQAHSS
jgi:hypothetical protein